MTKKRASARFFVVCDSNTFLLPPGEGGAQRRMRVRAKPRAVETTRASPRTLTPTPAPRPGPRLLRGRSKPRAPVARKRCLVAPAGEGL
ncbi:hypothetical protein XcyCFBP4188_08120 [Xanthomonas hortorum pv. cynarae]|nr:hypothetical protein XcyCFBP4188_08120 [Xanthomonas hortorum pv. cynarae]